MKRLYPLALFYTVITLTSCTNFNSMQSSNQNKATVVKTAELEKKSEKNPISVAFYPGASLPNHPYKILGKAIVPEYNPVGIKRQEAIIRDTLRQLAASIGGDAVINITHDKESITGTVVAYDKGTTTAKV